MSENIRDPKETALTFFLLGGATLSGALYLSNHRRLGVAAAGVAALLAALTVAGKRD